MRATHWHAEADPDDWEDNPIESKEEAAKLYLWEGRKADSHQYELRRYGSTKVIVHGFIKTDHILEEQSQFDGYSPGDKYFMPTSERAEMRFDLSLQES